MNLILSKGTLLAQ